MTMMSSIYLDEDLYSSPRGVMDVRLFQIDDDKLLHDLECLQTPSMSLLPWESADDTDTDASPPPLNTLSVSSLSASNDDDSGSLSSVSLDEDAWETSSTPAVSGFPEKRCIFASYWKKKGGRPKQPLLIPPSLVLTPEQGHHEDQLSESGSSSCSSEDGKSYEDLLEKTEAPVARRRKSSRSTPGSAPPRRRLWDNRYVSQSEPSLPRCMQGGLLIRKVQSASVVQQPRSSCLRRGRFSSSTAAVEPEMTLSRRSSETTSVSFSDEVQVKYLMPVTENWASRGWSKHFV